MINIELYKCWNSNVELKTPLVFPIDCLTKAEQAVMKKYSNGLRQEIIVYYMLNKQHVYALINGVITTDYLNFRIR